MVRGLNVAVQSLWTGTATVTVREGVLDPTTGRTVQRERELYTGLPCRLSYRTAAGAVEADAAAKTAQSVTLYLARGVDIPEGSRILVVQNGVTGAYARSGYPAVYTAHQEIPLELFGGWA